MKPLAECRLYAFVDSAYLNGQKPRAIARQLCDGGVDLIQLRAKDWSAERIRETALKLLPITQSANVGLVVNDHWKIADEIGADICHLGQEDFFETGYTSTAELKPTNPKLRLGLSTHTPKQAERAIKIGADYLAFGPVYATPTKSGRPAVTLDYVRWAAKYADRPWFAIGGITLENAEDVLEAGARRICVVSEILNAPHITRACKQFRERLASVPLD